LIVTIKSTLSAVSHYQSLITFSTLLSSLIEQCCIKSTLMLRDSCLQQALTADYTPERNVLDHQYFDHNYT